jgi:hypothetical protein
MQPTSGADFLIQLAPLIILMIPIAIGAFYLAPKVGANRWLWAILLLIPIVNFFTFWTFVFLVAGRILDRLNAITNRMQNLAPSA